MLIPYNNIREHYTWLTPKILENSRNVAAHAWCSPYTSFIDWPSIFSPIEWDAWQVIRGDGRCPLYPQYPVGKYFVDFGNPFVKVALECDGYEYHLDKEKDNARDYKLSELGWRVYRIPGKDCRRPVNPDYYEYYYYSEQTQYELLCEYYFSTIEGLIGALALTEFGHKSYFSNEWINELEIAERCIEKRLSKPLKEWKMRSK